MERCQSCTVHFAHLKDFSVLIVDNILEGDKEHKRKLTVVIIRKGGDCLAGGDDIWDRKLINLETRGKII